MWGQLMDPLMFADDLVILPCYSSGLQQLIRVCTIYGVQYIAVFTCKVFNSKLWSAVMIATTKKDQKLNSPLSI